MAQFEIGMSVFRIKGSQLEVLFGEEWLQVWKFKIVENWGDLAIDTNLKKDNAKVIKRSDPKDVDASRLITDEDIVIFELENGKNLTMVLTPKVNEMVRILVDQGFEFERGKNVKRKTPYKDEL